MNDATSSSDADGVLVLSVWRNASADGTTLVRLTMTEPGGTGDTVRVVSNVVDALADLEKWLAAMIS
jgi:hypothetical protein